MQPEHTYQVLTDPADIEYYVQPIMRSIGSDTPAPGCGVVFAEFDANGEVVAFQILQSAIFAEGMWARDGSAHLRRIWNMTIDYARNLAGSGKDLLTMTRGDKQGNRIGRAVQRMGFKETGFKVYRRKL
jgi:hypothetical protein